MAEIESTKIGAYQRYKDRLYHVWNTMIQRCYNPKCPNFHHYGGRGISVCDEWRNSFFSFKGWAISYGYDYSKTRKDQQLDRRDNDGNYCPENCHWVTASENGKNRRYLGRVKVKHRPHKPHARHKLHDGNGVSWTINGETKPMCQWCDQYGISYQLAQYRVKKCGMTPLEALTKEKAPIQGRPKKRAV